MIRTLRRTVLLVTAAFAPAAAAQDCITPSPLDYLRGYYATAAWEGPAATTCALRVSLINGGRPPQTGFASATFSTALPRVRLRFHVDASALTGMNVTQTVMLLNLVAAETPSLPGTSEKTSSLARVALYGNLAGTTRYLGLAAGNESTEEGISRGSLSTLPGQFDLGIEVVTGLSGTVKLWIDSDFDAAPTMVLPVSNTAWTGVSGIAVGLLDPSPNFATAQAGRDVVISNFALYETLFGNGFE